MYNLEITNYQIIKHTTIQFKPGLTLITGHSNNGKSSIIKAFKQLAYNTPGSDYITHHSTKTTIQLTTPNNDQVVYSKSKQGASYSINNQAPLSKIGSSSVPQVEDLLHINKDLNYNFWNQLDKPFLISLSPKEQFDLLQQSPHTQTLQSTLQLMVSDRKSLQTQLTQNQSKLELLQQQDQEYHQQLQNLDVYSHLYQQITKLKDKQSLLKELLNTFNSYQQIDLLPLQHKIQSLQNLPSLKQLEDKFTTLNSTQNLFQQLLQTQYPINQLQQEAHNYQSEYDKVHLFLQTNFQVCPLCNQPFHNN